MERAYYETESGERLEVCDNGDIYHNGKLLKPRNYSSTGYKYVQIHNKNYLVHRLVACVFIKNLERGNRNLQVHHINENKADNRLENLQILSMKEHQNLHKRKYADEKKCVICGKTFIPAPSKRKRQQTCSVDCKRILVKKKAEKRKVPILQCDIYGNIIKLWDSSRDAQNELGFYESNINKCCNGHIQTYKGYVWKYAERGSDETNKENR